MLRTPTWAYSWAGKIIQHKAYFIIKCWIFMQFIESVLKVKSRIVEWMQVCWLFNLDIEWLTGSCGCCCPPSLVWGKIIFKIRSMVSAECLSLLYHKKKKNKKTPQVKPLYVVGRKVLWNSSFCLFLELSWQRVKFPRLSGVNSSFFYETPLRGCLFSIQ